MRKKIDKSKTFSIGSTIAHYRKKKGTTQSELAEALGVTQRVISYYENPTTNLSIDIISRIAVALDVPIRKLLDATNTDIKEAPLPIRALQKKLELVPKLPLADQQYIAKMIELIAIKNGLLQAG